MVNFVTKEHQETFHVKAPPPIPVFPSDIDKVHPVPVIPHLYSQDVASPRYRGEQVTNPTKRGATFRQITNDFLATTSLHAVPHVRDAPFRCLRCLWLVVFVVMCVLLGLHVRTIALKYYAYPTQVTIKIKREDSLEFPAVTVCNQNPIPRSILEKTKVKQIVQLDSELACGRLNGTTCVSFEGGAKRRFEEAALRCSNTTIKCKKLDYFGSGYGLGIGEENSDSEWHYNYTDGLDDPFYWYDYDLETESTGTTESWWIFDPTASTSEGNFQSNDTTESERSDLPDSTTEQMYTSTDTPSTSSYDYWNNIGYYDTGYLYDYSDDNEQFLVGSQLKASDIEDIVRKSKVSDLTDVTNLISIKYNELLSGENGTKIEDFILECSYDRQNCETSEYNFKVFYNKAYGKCYTFNSELGHIHNSSDADDSHSVHARRYGSEYGLRLTLNINQSEYVGLLASSYGARITIHTPTETPYPHLDGYDAPPGMVTVAAIKRTFIGRLSAPFESQCFDHIPDEYTELGLVEDGISYSRRGCRIACMDSAMYKECGCIDQSTFINVAMHKKFATCNVFNKTQHHCQRDVTRQFQYSSDRTDARRCFCSAACNETSYRRTLSMAKWPTRQFVDLYINNMPRDSRIWKMYNRVETEKDAYFFNDPMKTVEQNLVRLHVYYEELNYEYIQEHEAYGLPNLLADLGGVIGLYLGLSVSTVLEVFQYFGFLAMFKFYESKQ